MFNLSNIEIQNTNITNIETIKQQIKDSLEYLGTLRALDNNNYDTICENLKISTNIEQNCKEVVAKIVTKTGDIHDLISSLEVIQKEARSLRLQLDKAKKEFKTAKINEFNCNYLALLSSKASELVLKLPKCNLEEEIGKFYKAFILVNFKGIQEVGLDSKNELNQKEIDAYLRNIDFQIKAFNQSEFANNVIPISVKFIDNILIIEFNDKKYTSFDYEEVKAEYDLMIKIQQEQEEAKQKAINEALLKEQEALRQEALAKQEQEKALLIKKVEAIQVPIVKSEINKEESQENNKKDMLFIFKNIAKNKINNITKDNIIIVGDIFSITIEITKEELVNE
jgi:hypothetical protein